jgi:hypothetical protein
MTTTTSREIWVGECANLSSLRAGIQANSTEIALKQVLDSSVNEKVLCQMKAVQLICSSAISYDDDEDGEGDEASSGSQWSNFMTTNKNKDAISGLLIVTTQRILFCSTEPHCRNDVSIDAGCINLHALSNEPYDSVFVQVEHDHNNGNNDDGEPVDITLIPCEEGQCQTMFDALSKLVTLHPILPDEDEEGDGDDDDDDLMMAMMMNMNKQTRIGDDDDDGDVTDEEREAMLRRLDNLLIVPPELQVDDDDDDEEGQFDDADEALL